MQAHSIIISSLQKDSCPHVQELCDSRLLQADARIIPYTFWNSRVCVVPILAPNLRVILSGSPWLVFCSCFCFPASSLVSESQFTFEWGMSRMYVSRHTALPGRDALHRQCACGSKKWKTRFFPQLLWLLRVLSLFKLHIAKRTSRSPKAWGTVGVVSCSHPLLHHFWWLVWLMVQYSWSTLGRCAV